MAPVAILGTGGLTLGDRHIIATYNHLADACLVALVIIYAIFALRLNHLPEIIRRKFRPDPAGD